MGEPRKSEGRGGEGQMDTQECEAESVHRIVSPHKRQHETHSPQCALPPPLPFLGPSLALHPRLPVWLSSCLSVFPSQCIAKERCNVFSRIFAIRSLSFPYRRLRAGKGREGIQAVLHCQLQRRRRAGKRSMVPTKQEGDDQGGAGERGEGCNNVAAEAAAVVAFVLASAMRLRSKIG